MGDRPGKNDRKKSASRARKRKGDESITEGSTLPIDVVEEEIDDVGDPNLLFQEKYNHY